MRKAMLGLFLAASLFSLGTLPADATTKTLEQEKELLPISCMVVLCPNDTVCVEKNGAPQCVPIPDPK